MVQCLNKLKINRFSIFIPSLQECSLFLLTNLLNNAHLTQGIWLVMVLLSCVVVWMSITSHCWKRLLLWVIQHHTKSLLAHMNFTMRLQMETTKTKYIFPLLSLLFCSQKNI